MQKTAVENQFPLVDSPDDVVDNIRTLYSYLSGKVDDEHKKWAADRLKKGVNFFVEIIDGNLCFAPSLFVGYKENTLVKHKNNPYKDGEITNNRLKDFYFETSDDRLKDELDAIYQEANITPEKRERKFWIRKGTSVEDLLKSKKKRYWVAKVSEDSYWDKAIEEQLWLCQQRYEHQDSGAVTRTLNCIKEVSPGDILLLSYENKIRAYGTVIECPYETEQISEISRVINNREHEFDKGRVRFSDSSVFYEELEPGCENWGQRMKVAEWCYYSPQSEITTKGVKNACLSGAVIGSIFGVDPSFGEGKMEELKKQYLKNRGCSEFVNKSKTLLLNKHNIILQGAPGTGKTYNTAAIALSTLDITDINFNDHNEVMTRYTSLQDKRIFFTTFHQSLDYEDFVEGLRPHIGTDMKGNSLGVTYEPQDGIFKQACNAAKDKSVVLIIDEINRGNVSKIFGELITLLESDKRNKGLHPLKVTLPYSKELFAVPSDLYIIGTMNTTDRSTGNIDYALRRRFAFITLESDRTVIEQHYNNNSELKKRAVDLFNDIKDFIEDDEHLCVDFDIRDLMIGHSYFMADSEESLRYKVEYEILPLISEYINDGILNVKSKEKKEAFEVWKELKTRQQNATTAIDNGV